jgi:hypothetical protein
LVVQLQNCIFGNKYIVGEFFYKKKSTYIAEPISLCSKLLSVTNKTRKGHDQISFLELLIITIIIWRESYIVPLPQITDGAHFVLGFPYINKADTIAKLLS